MDSIATRQRQISPTAASRRSIWIQGFPASAIRYPPFIDPTFSNGTAPIGYPADGLMLPRYQNWSLTYQRQIGESVMVDVSYLGNKGTRLPHNPQFLGPATT